MNKIDKISKELLNIIQDCVQVSENTYTLSRQNMVKLLEIESIARQIGKDINKINQKIIANKQKNYESLQMKISEPNNLYKKHWIFKIVAWIYIVFGILTFGILVYFVIHLKELFKC